ncbi:pyridoxal phosphate-dependent aminotransferase [Psychromarinibacter sp. C21-152]|uniref:Aminotransferase n=1 Tax=Psychromarinibacter sediminicola TaxID=3033385 RepID=A0AAE3NYW6_9RHOB|nr:pyridoxal phosphate-dependent aminotransferase [Psychromarinibacter sediminicola]MDF0603242.1 pyridoxal phosphate-dependent aminotransferase [Psychromarinibacter sediminicola]
MQLSKRILTLTDGGSDGWDVYRRARSMAEAGHPVIELTIGDHDVPTDPAILDAMHAAALDGSVGYPIVPGLPELRDAIAARVQARTGAPTTRDNVVIMPGGQGALFSAEAATCDHGDTALFVEPYYATYPGSIRGVGATPVPVPALPEHDFQPQASTILAAARETGARSLLINTPHNPTGVVYTMKTLRGIADVCKATGMWLISDEVYDTQVWDGAHLSPRALPGMAERTLVIGSMSKSHAMTGSRIGWIVGPEEAVEHLINLSTHTTYGLPAYIQEAALFALQEGAELEAEITGRFRHRRALALEVLSKSNRIHTVPSHGAMYLMLDIRATGLSGEDFANLLLDEEEIGVMPGESFGRTAAGHVRIALTVDEAVLEDALRRLVAFAERLAHAA